MHTKKVSSIWCGTIIMPLNLVFLATRLMQKHASTLIEHLHCSPLSRGMYELVCVFNAYSNAVRLYSVWPIVVCVHNLPPHLCMTRPYMFLSFVIPRPNNPKNEIDVFLQPVIDELKMLWNEGVDMYDIHANQTFKMKAASMWTINDFPVYGMLSGWSTHGPLSCPICQDQMRESYLEHGHKMSWFDCHRCFLPRNHVFRRNRNAFTWVRVVHSQPPQRLTPEME